MLPHVVYRDVEDAITWLIDKFGFREHYRYGEPASGAQMHLGDAWIMLKRAQPDAVVPAESGHWTQSLTVFVEDVDAHFERTKSRGAQIVEDLHETEYGERQYGVVDLAGHHWLFSKHARDVNPADWGATVAERAINAPQISPMLSVRNGAKAIGFYKSAFGADVLFRLDAEDGAVVAELSVGGARFWVADESPENFNFSPESLGGGSVRLVIIVSDPDTAFDRAIKAGGKVIWPVDDQPYGWRIGRLVDPFGHHWEIGKLL